MSGPAPELMLLEQMVCGVTGCGRGKAGAVMGELLKLIAESRLPTSFDVSRAASDRTFSRPDSKLRAPGQPATSKLSGN